MTPYYDEAGITIYHGDCNDVLPAVEFGAVVTDPPYGIQAEYKPHGNHVGERVDWDDAVPYGLLCSLLPRPVLWFGSPTKMAEAFRAFTPPPERVLIWAPSFSLAMSSAKRIAYRFHPVYTWNLPIQQRTVHDVLRDPTVAGNWWDHPATKPVSLMSRLVDMAGDAGTILDPFMGSGTTLRAAKDLGRKAIGVELEESYCELAARRLAQEVLDFGGAP